MADLHLVLPQDVKRNLKRYAVGHDVTVSRVVTALARQLVAGAVCLTASDLNGISPEASAPTKIVASDQSD